MKTALVAGAVVVALAGSVAWWAGTDDKSPPQGGISFTAVTVRTVPASEEMIAITVESSGTVRANEAVEITSQLAAVVTAIGFKEGARAERGAVLVKLDDAQARAALAEAEAALTNSRGNYERSRELAIAAAVSKAQLQQIEAELQRDEARVAAARARLADTVIKAPFSGLTGLRRVSLGAFVTPGMVITTLDDISAVKVDFAVPEPTLPALRAGLSVTATSPVYPGRVFTGTVDSVDPRLDLNTRAIQVRARFENPKHELTPGMFVAVSLVREQQLGIVVPESAVIPEQDKQFVFVVENGKALRREVEIGHRVPGRVQIRSAVMPGERVVVDGALKLRDGMQVSDVSQTPTATGAST